MRQRIGVDDLGLEQLSRSRMGAPPRPSRPERRRSKDLYENGVHWKREILYTRAGILFTSVATILLVSQIIGIASQALAAHDSWKVVEQLLFAIVVGLLIFGNLAYQIARAGYLFRLGAHRPAAREELDRLYETNAPHVMFLIPSYKEDRRVILQSLWSAALQEYPCKRVVLLIDDPPFPAIREDEALLATVRQLPAEIEAALAQPAARTEFALDGFLQRKFDGALRMPGELRRLSDLHVDVACWFEDQAESHPITDHAEELSVERTFREPALAHRKRAEELRERASCSAATLDEALLAREYRRLATLFSAELTSFERKRYKNLSHEPNKAMNLNSYIGLMGKTLREVRRGDVLFLEPASTREAHLDVESADYVVTLDADSILSPDYALRLVEIMERPGNERLAVAQTPYSAFPNAPGLSERVAGATTDMQYIVHQGFTRFHATYWVGANALMRTAALHDIATTEVEDGFEIKRFISDRTVIEDTESTVDLVARGWTLYNYPRRLSYSATPSDFGSLLVQRRRWANGGLIILPKLLGYLIRGPWRLRSLQEGFMRVHYLVSIAAVNLSVPVLLAYAFEDNLRSLWLPLSALPYFLLYGRDLVLAGYGWADLLRVYALNLMLIPVNLGGVFKSLQQGLSGQRIPFKRTPKVMGVTTAPPLYVLAEFFIVAYCLVTAAVDVHGQRWMHVIFALVNVCFFIYALVRFVRPIEALGYGPMTEQRRVS